MKIIILGNIGSGKTTISKKVASLNTDYEYLAIDDFRRRISDGTIKGDSKAKSAFVKSIHHHDDINQIIECSGLGRLGSSVYRRCKKFEGQLVVVVLDVELEKCMERIKDRVWDIPFPTEILQGEDLVKKLYKQYQTTILFERWGLRKNTSFLLVRNNNQEDFNTIIKVISSIIKNEPT